MRILFLSTRQAKPSFRFRVEQFLPHFENAGHQCDVAFLPASNWARLKLYRSFSNYDVVVIQKRLLSSWELAVARRFARRMVYDFDDAIMFNGSGQNDGRRQKRFQRMIGQADHVIAGNAYLAEQASKYSTAVTVIPTCLNTDLFVPREKPRQPADDRLTIGWTGSRSTTRYLNVVLPVLAEFGDSIQLKIIADSIDDVDLSLLGNVAHRFIRWSPENEIAEAATFDIGLMPLPDDPWTRGKCGFKALQYLALGIPAVCSPVGVNTEIVRDGETGLLANSSTEWKTALSKLVESSELRQQLGNQGRTHVEENYSVASQAPRLISLIEAVSQNGATRAAG